MVLDAGRQPGSYSSNPCPKNEASLRRDRKRRLAQEQVQLHRLGGGEGGPVRGSFTAVSQVKGVGGGS